MDAFRLLILSIDRLVTRAVLAVAGLLLAAAACIGMYQVIARFVLQQPATWSEVLAQTLIVWMVFLGIGGGFRAGVVAAVDVAWRVARGQARTLLEAGIALTTLIFLALIAWFGWDMAYRVRFQRLAGLDISIAWAYAAIPVGAALAMIAVLARWIDPDRQEPAAEETVG